MDHLCTPRRFGAPARRWLCGHCCYYHIEKKCLYCCWISWFGLNLLARRFAFCLCRLSCFFFNNLFACCSSRADFCLSDGLMYLLWTTNWHLGNLLQPKNTPNLLFLSTKKPFVFILSLLWQLGHLPPSACFTYELFWCINVKVDLSPILLKGKGIFMLVNCTL